MMISGHHQSYRDTAVSGMCSSEQVASLMANNGGIALTGESLADSSLPNITRDSVNHFVTLNGIATTDKLTGESILTQIRCRGNFVEFLPATGRQVRQCQLFPGSDYRHENRPGEPFHSNWRVIRLSQRQPVQSRSRGPCRHLSVAQSLEISSL